MSRTATQVRAPGPVRRRRSRRPNHRLRALRINAGLSPNDLALRAGISGNTVRMAEAGLLVQPRTQFAIAEVFDKLPLDIWPLEEQA